MRRKSAETHQRIIDAAYTLFYQSGFMRTGVDAVADAAGITKRTLIKISTNPAWSKTCTLDPSIGRVTIWQTGIF
jgi:hypothetical protein